VEVNVHSNLNASSVSEQTPSTSSLSSSSSLFDKLMAQNVNEEEVDQEFSSLRGLASISQDLATLNENAKDTVKNLQKDIESSSEKSNTHDQLSLILQLRNLQAS